MTSDLLHATGAATLTNATLTLDLNGLSTATGPITIVSDNSQTGTFSSVNVVNNPHGYAYSLAYGGNSVTVTLSPTVTSSTASLPVTSTTMTINGTGFDTTTAHDSVTFNDGVTGTVTAATGSSLTVSLTNLGSLTGGTALDASVTADGISSGSQVQVATVAPVVTPSTASLLASATSMTISGFGFDTTAAHDSVSFDNGVTGSVTGATSSSLTVSLTGLGSVGGGTALHASVTVDGTSNGSSVQVATVQSPLANTTTTLTDNGPNPSYVGQAVTFTVNTTGVPDGATVYLDNVNLEDAVIGSVTISGGTGSTTISSFSWGTAQIIAAYGGDGTHAPSQSSQISQVVNIVTTTTCTDNGPNSSLVAVPVSYTVNTTGVPDGSTVYLEDASNSDTVVGSVVVNSSGTGSTTVSSLALGTHEIFALLRRRPRATTPASRARFCKRSLRMRRAGTSSTAMPSTRRFRPSRPSPRTRSLWSDFDRPAAVELGITMASRYSR